MSSLKEKTAKGLLWGGMNNGIQQLVGLATGIVLGRLLSPHDYGMMAMLAIFSLIANELQSSGFKVALINEKSPTHDDFNSVFWFNILMALFIYVVLFFCAPLIASYYNNPELIGLSRYAFLSFIFSSLGMAQSAWLTKQLRFRQLAQAGITSVVVSSIGGIILAWQGFSYWALATQANLFILCHTIMLWCYSSWRPTLHFTFGPVRRMFRFSCKLLISSVLTHVNTNVLNMLLGRYYHPHDVGNYNQAYQWNFKCYTLIQGMLIQVAQPVLVELRDDRVRELQAFRKMVRFASFLSFPLLYGFALVSHEFIVLAITEKWLSAVPLLRWLCLSSAVMPLCTLMSNLLITHGRSSQFMWTTLAQGVLQIALLLVLYPYGVEAVVIGYSSLLLLWTLVWFVQVNRLVGYRFHHFLLDILPFALIAAVVMAVTYFATRSISSLWLLLLSRIVMAAVLYYLILRLLGAKILKESMSFLRGSLRHKGA